MGTSGVSSVGDVQLLRNIFRSIQAEEVPSNIQNVGKSDMGELHKLVQAKLAELENLVGRTMAADSCHGSESPHG